MDISQTSLRQYIIYGAGSIGGHIALNAELYGIKECSILGFLDDNKNKHGKLFCNYTILGDSDWLTNRQVSIILAIANPHIKKKILNKLKAEQVDFPTLIAKNSWISKGCTIGKGSILYPNSSINYQTKIGDFVIINMNCAVGHDVSIEDYVSLAPSVSVGGNTKIGKCVQIGIGTSVKQKIIIKKKAIVAGQSMVIRNVFKNEIVGGIPAKTMIFDKKISMFS